MDNDLDKWRSGDEDIITNLSEDLISPILERLPVKDAVRTSVLSKKWRYRWTTVGTLSLDEQFSRRFLKRGAYHRCGFIRTINKIMIHHKGPILKFLLHLPKEINLDTFREVDQWMLILSRNGVRILHIMNSNPIYQLPSYVFSCIELRQLKLYSCIFKPPLGFQGFLNLEDIFFTSVQFGGSSGGSVINLPQLKKLTLYSCTNVNKFNIKAVRLRTLNVVSCRHVMSLLLLHCEHLDVVCICLKNNIEYSQRLERLKLGIMLTNLPNLTYFTLDGYFLKFLAAEEVPKWLPHAVNCLKHLELQRIGFGDLDQVQGALCMLRNSPNLKVLRVTHVQMGPEANVEVTSSYLESPDCLDQTLLTLQTVEMTSFEGSKPELLFIKLLLDHSPHLENMVIRPRADAQKMLDIAKDVMLFPRASTKAKMVYLDPKP